MSASDDGSESYGSSDEEEQPIALTRISTMFMRRPEGQDGKEGNDGKEDN